MIPRTSHRVVKQALQIALADLETTPYFPTIARKLGVSERFLRRAFNSVHGLPPQRYVRMLKLSRAQLALASARDPSVTVAETALRLGFTELGRFSVRYREMFGERPSTTLQRALRRHEGKKRAPKPE